MERNAAVYDADVADCSDHRLSVGPQHFPGPEFDHRHLPLGSSRLVRPRPSGDARRRAWRLPLWARWTLAGGKRGSGAEASCCLKPEPAPSLQLLPRSSSATAGLAEPISRGTTSAGAATSKATLQGDRLDLVAFSADRTSSTQFRIQRATNGVSRLTVGKSRHT